MRRLSPQQHYPLHLHLDSLLPHLGQRGELLGLGMLQHLEDGEAVPDVVAREGAGATDFHP